MYCKICNKKLDALFPYKCRRCKQYFCKNHRLPEQHSCPNLRTSWDIWEHRKKKLQTIEKESYTPKKGISSKLEKIYIEDNKKYDDNFFKKCSCCSIGTINLSQCQYCNQWFCKDHLKPKKSQEYEYLRTPGGHSCKPFIEQQSIAKQKHKYEPITKVKKPLYKHSNKFIRWFFSKKYLHSHLRKNFFF